MTGAEKTIYISVSEAAFKLGVTERRMRQILEEHQGRPDGIQAHKIVENGWWKVDETSLREYISRFNTLPKN